MSSASGSFLTTAAALNEATTNSTQNDDLDYQKALMVKITTYLGAGIAILGVSMTLLSYIGYRKFHVKRPHIIMVNLCFCLFLYFFAYLISNPERLSSEENHATLCLIGSVILHFSSLATWHWILVYWILLLVMMRRPMGGHISHFFIKASVPSYGIPLIITVICFVVANQKDEMKLGYYFGKSCAVHQLYRDVGAFVPFVLLFLPMLAIFVVYLKEQCCRFNEKSTSQKNLARQFTRLTIITLLLGITFSSGFVQLNIAEKNLAAMMLFGVVSLVLGLALMVLFCLHHEEIRQHWVSVIRGEAPALRKHSITRNTKYEIGDVSPSRKSSTIGGRPSVFVDCGEQRNSSMYRMVPKEDTDMSNLNLIPIPGTSKPERSSESTSPQKLSSHSKVKRKKSQEKLRIKSTESQKSEEDKKDKRKSRRVQSSSTPPSESSPKHKKMSKRQMTSDDVFSSKQNGKKRPSKRDKLFSRYQRKSVSALDDDTEQLTQINET